MNWKLLIGQTLGKAEMALLKSNLSFVSKNYPYRRNWIFDLKRQLPQANIIFDVGAYFGDVSLELNQRFPDAKIYAFEPVKSSFNQLKKNTSLINNICIENAALGDKEGILEIPLFAAGSVNTLKDAEYDTLPITAETINVLRLDNFMMKNAIDQIDIFKIDVEGYELEVLKGAGELLNKVSCIVTEVGYQRCNTKTYFTDMDQFMEDNGFQLFNIYELMPEYGNKTRLFYSDNVYLNKRLISNPVS